MRFETDCRQLILEAAEIARDCGHSYVGSEHLLAALCCESGWVDRKSVV